MIPFMSYAEKGKTIAAANRLVVARDWDYKEVVTIKPQKGVFGVMKLFLIPIVVLVT